MKKSEAESSPEFLVCVACGMDGIFERDRNKHEVNCKQAHHLLSGLQTAICAVAIANCNKSISEGVKDAALRCFEKNTSVQRHETTDCEGGSIIDSIEKEEMLEGKVTIRVGGKHVSVIPIGQSWSSTYSSRTYYLSLESSYDLSTASLTDLNQYMRTSPPVGRRVLIYLLESVMSLLQSHKAHRLLDVFEGIYVNELEDAKNLIVTLALQAVSQLCKSSKSCSLSLGAHRGRGYNVLLEILLHADDGDCDVGTSQASVSAQGVDVLAGIFAFGPVPYFDIDMAMRLLPPIVRNYVRTAESAEKAYEILVKIKDIYNAEVELDGGRTRDEAPPTGDLHYYICALQHLNSNAFAGADMKEKSSSAIRRIQGDLREETRVVGRREKRISTGNCPDCEQLCPHCAEIWFQFKKDK
jgi:hypothetical protein